MTKKWGKTSLSSGLLLAAALMPGLACDESTPDAVEDPTDNEFDTIIRNITPLLEDIGIQALQENKELRDITFLQNETGFENIKLEHLVVSHSVRDLRLFIGVGGVSVSDAAAYQAL